MTNLISAGLARLWKAKIFLFSVVFMFLISVLVIINQYRTSLDYGLTLSLNNIIFGYTLIIGIVAAAFSSLFLGAEYSDGTIRNKLVAGHTRAAIYCSNLIVTIIAALLMSAAYLIAVFAFGMPLIGALDLSDIGPLAFAATIFGSIAMICAVCAILTAISMLISNKAVAAIVSIFVMLGILLFAIEVESRLLAPEFYSPFTIVSSDENGPMELAQETVENPQYLRGAERRVYEYIFDILPAGQALQYARMGAVHLWQMPLYSLAIVLLFTLFGYTVFRKKNIN